MTEENADPAGGRVTQLLLASRQGDAGATDELFRQLYGELCGIAERVFRSQGAGHTLQPTALVHEAFLKLALSAGGAAQAQDRAHFLNLAARAMRQILVNHARDRQAAKRGGGSTRQRVTLSDQVARDVGGDALDVLALEERLQELARLDERQARIVELRAFGGLTNQEVADTLGVSLRTVELDWRMAKAWLATRLRDDPDP